MFKRKSKDDMQDDLNSTSMKDDQICTMAGGYVT